MWAAIINLPHARNILHQRFKELIKICYVLVSTGEDIEISLWSQKMYFLGFSFPSWKQARVCRGYIHWPSAFLLRFSSSERIVSTSHRSVLFCPFKWATWTKPGTLIWSTNLINKEEEWECLPLWLVLSTWHELESPGKRDSWEDASIRLGSRRSVEHFLH